MLFFEHALWSDGYRLVAGVDEVGRGPLAGPVVAVAVILKEDPDSDLDLEGIQDSKTLTVTAREALVPVIFNVSVAVGISATSARLIDRIGISSAVYRAMAGALRNLLVRPDFVLVDGPILIPSSAFLRAGFTKPFLGEAIIRGDSRSRSIAAASIIAKVTRDRLMRRLGSLYPEYGFEHHKGYGTAEHLSKIASLGPTPHHRMSFAPLREPEMKLAEV